MKRFDEIKEKLFYPTGAFFVVVLFVFFGFLKLTMPQGVVALSVRDTFCLLGYSLGLSGARLILHTDFGSATRYVLHAVAVLADFVLFVLLLTGHMKGKGFSAVVISIVYMIGYLIVMAIRGAVLSAKKEEANQAKDYTNRFSK